MKKVRINFLKLLALLSIPLIAGTLIWLLYPTIHHFFPNAAENGFIPRYVSWWKCVCLYILITIFREKINY